MKNRVLFNGLAYAPNGAGISKYTEQLLKAFLRGNYPVDILLRKDYKVEYQGLDSIIFAQDEISNSGQRIIMEQWKMKQLYKEYALVHFPDYATPVCTMSSSVATIHDMAMKSMQEKYTFLQRNTKRLLLQNTIYRAKGILCISEFTKKELLNYYPHIEHRIEVIYLGLAKAEKCIKKEILEKWGLQTREYILFVGTIAPHKNIISLIKAFSLLKQKGYSGKLVIAGGKGWMYDEILTFVKNSTIQNQIVFTDYVDEVTLETLYYFAECFVCVSLYEGFGFPPLEAMARNLPVVVSDLPVFHETVADCGLYCQADSEYDIADKISRIIQDKNFAASLSEKGVKRTALFSWEKTAEKTWKWYQKFLI